MKELPGVHWPAVLRIAGDSELVLIEDETMLAGRIGEYGLSTDVIDNMIDSRGGRFDIVIEEDRFTLTHLDVAMPLSEFLGLVKAHLAQQGSCCVAKFYTADFREAFAVLSSIQE